MTKNNFLDFFGGGKHTHNTSVWLAMKSPVQFQSFSVGLEVPTVLFVPITTPVKVKFRAGQGAGGGAKVVGCFDCSACKASRRKKAKVDPRKCLTIAAAAVPEAAEVRLLEDSVGFAAALHKGASTAQVPAEAGAQANRQAFTEHGGSGLDRPRFEG